MSQKSLTDIVHDRDACGVQLPREFAVAHAFRPFYQGSDAMALLLRGLPSTQILESIDNHDPRLRTLDAKGHRSRTVTSAEA
jgi:hypothetical protein